MRSAKLDSRGFTLIASLLLMLLLSGVAVALLMMVNSEQKVGATDLSNNYTYRATEGAMEKMTSDLANVFKSIQSPQTSDICGVSANYPTWDTTVTYPVYNVAPVNPGVSNPCAAPLPAPVWGQIMSGQEANLYAQIIPVTLNASAQRYNGETVSMTRTAEVALIPVFQFGVFCDGDCFYGQSPNLAFAGRVHTNGDLYLGVANGYSLVFGDKLSAFGNVIRQQMDNGVTVGGGMDDGTVMIPTTSNGCATQLNNLMNGITPTTSATCVDISTTALGATDGSVTGGHGSAQFAPWYNVSLGTPYQGYLIDGNGTPGGTTDGPNGTGATDLTLPFVQGTTSAVQIIRRPLPGEAITSLLGGSRLANEAQIRILISDTPAGVQLSDFNGNLASIVEMASKVPPVLVPLLATGATPQYQNGITIGPNSYIYYFGETDCGTTTINAAPAPSPTCNRDPNFISPPYYALNTGTPFPAAGSFTQANNIGEEWPVIDGYLLVEAKWASDEKWHGVTQEWLQLGFARGLSAPNAPGTNTLTYKIAGVTHTDTDMANAILYLQQQADRNGDGQITDTSDEMGANNTVYPFDTSSSVNYSQYNWYPINLYDAREGENYDANQATGGPFATFARTTGTPNGIMNVVELDVGNLRNWLLGKTGTTGTNVDFSTYNGYILYFSDRRGENIAGATLPVYQGEYGFEDTVNYVNASSKFAPDNKLEPNNYNGVSPEDVNGNLALDTYGVRYVGDAFGTTTQADTEPPAAKPSPYAINHRINTFTYGRANRVTGARHVLKLVDGSLGNLPTMPPGNTTNNCSQTAANPTGCGGFTVGSENPVYIQGNYNSNCPTAVGGNPSPCTPGNANYDQTWTSTTNPEPNHAAASVIADAVIMLSNNWQDAGTTSSTTNGSLMNPTNPSGQNQPATQPNRIAETTYYRVAVAGGKNIAFLNTTQNPEFSYGMDGGIHNFLRFLEDWGGISPATQQSLYYKGSLVSLYWAQYATGPFKCCNLVYNPPDRHYVFDPLFALPQNLPPGTPMFRNVDNLSYRQNQVARTN